MKKQKKKTYLLRAILLSALVLGVWSWVQSRPVAPVVGQNAEDAGTSKRSLESKKTKKGRAPMEKTGFVQDIDRLTIKNNDFRQVIYTASHCQLVLMALKPKEEIGEESHMPDQFFRVEAGSGEVVLNGVRTSIRAGFAVIVPSGAKHNIINTGDVPMKLYTIYAPPNHRDGVVHPTRKDAETDHEHFDGKTTE
jgi:mannose-6-phosphate isomerase-like protein (cupin superfamily)